MTDTPDTPLDPIADALLHVEDDGYMGNSPADMLDENRAVSFPYSVYGRQFEVLAWTRLYDDRTMNKDKLSVVMYEPGTDLRELDDSVRHTDYIVVKHLHENSLDDADVMEDRQHMLATALGYCTRYLLDGRNYRFRSSTHTEPALDSLDVEPHQ